MSDIKINTNSYREEDVAFNWGVEFVKAMVDAHSRKGVIDHPDGSVSLPKLASDVKELINRALSKGEDNGEEISNLTAHLQKTDENVLTAQSTADTAVNKVSIAQGTADDAVAKANNAQSSANNAQTSADNAMAVAQNAKSQAEINKTDITTVHNYAKGINLVYKVYQLKAGETFTIKPQMFCIALPYGNKTIGIHKKDNSELISGNVGFTICFSPEINTGEYANGHNHRVVFFYQPQSVLTTIASHHDLLEVGAYLKNNGEGNMYVFALMREVDAV